MTCNATVRLSVENAIAPAQIKRTSGGLEERSSSAGTSAMFNGICGAPAGAPQRCMRSNSKPLTSDGLLPGNKGQSFLIGIEPICLQPFQKCRPCCWRASQHHSNSALLQCLMPTHLKRTHLTCRGVSLQATATLTVSISASTPVNPVSNVLAMLLEGHA